ncbi:uncharacterized protein LOC143902105 [Temnothorax americanus]|uniref:uncharacterized protein LOC143902105 n=1 Tax=Temnothorax americanus TaxID=1964332 RepID=UPI0040690CF1
MACRDYMIRVCVRNPCKMPHEVRMCTRTSCNGNISCKFVHLTEDEVSEINRNIRPFRENIYKEMKRLAYLLRESFPRHLRTHACTLNMLGECIWPCLACGTADRKTHNKPTCNSCYIILIGGDMTPLMCGHVYCKYCIERLPFSVDGPLPVNYCIKCNKRKMKMLFSKNIFNL